MANYMATTRTNYFRVTNEKKYEELFETLVSEDEIHDFTKIDEDGVIWHGFGSYSEIVCFDENEDYNIDMFFERLQEILPDNEAFILMESGYEKLRYITGFATVVTNSDIRCVDLHRAALDIAREMIGDPEWDTKMDY